MNAEIAVATDFLQAAITTVGAGLSSLSAPAVTVLTGSLVYALGHIIVKLGVEPVQDMNKLRGEIAEDLTYYANKTTSPGVVSGDERIEVGEVYREKASLLSAKSHKIPAYSFWEFLNLVPEKESVKEARSELIGLSNRVPLNEGSGNYEKIENIKSCLNLDFS